MIVHYLECENPDVREQESSMVGYFKMGFIMLSIFVGGVISYIGMGGVSGMLDSFPAFPWFSLCGKGEGAAVMTLVSMVVGVISTQSYAQAIFSAANTRCAALACLIAGAITIPVFACDGYFFVADVFYDGIYSQ